MKRYKLNRRMQLGLVVSATCMLIILSACNTPAEQTTATRPVSINRAAMVSATGKVIPENEALLSVSAGGVIENVLVKKGEAVSAGQVLVQLEGTEMQAAVVSAAELELVNAQFALDTLYKDTDLLAAEALRAAEMAEDALEDLYNTEQQEAQAIWIVAEAEQAYENAERELAYLTKRPTQLAIDQAYANMLLAENKLNKTLEDIAEIERQIKKYASMKNLPSKIRKGILPGFRSALKGLDIKRTQEQIAFNDAKVRYNDLLAPPDPIDLAVAEANFLTAQATLLQAQRDLERILDGPENGDVALLEAQIDKGYHDHGIYSAGPDPDDITLAEARVANAEAQVAAAKEILDDLELTAPFDGVISDVYINTNEWVTPGSPVLLIADLEHLQIETTDLGEIDVAQIIEGDIAVITFDALPDLVLEGTVVSISPKAAEGSGVNYPVLLELNNTHPSLRWGMTAFVDIELE